MKKCDSNLIVDISDHEVAVVINQNKLNDYVCFSASQTLLETFFKHDPVKIRMLFSVFIFLFF